MSEIAQQLIVSPAARVSGTIVVPGDKSISHRYALLAALARGCTRIRGFAPGGDCASTLACLTQLGIDIRRTANAEEGEPALEIDGRGLRGLRQSASFLDCGNSGSTMRMLAGVLAAHPFSSTLVGDASLSRRPMRRVITPLTAMGARCDAAADRPPLTIHGGDLQAIAYTPDVASAQVKTAVLLAALQTSGESSVTELSATRDHTERALRAFGIVVDTTGLKVALHGGQQLESIEARVPGDVSSAAFCAAAAAALPGSDVTLANVGVNPTRTAYLDVLRRFGARVEIEQTDVWQGEPVGRIRVRGGQLTSIVLDATIVPAIIDELPVLAALATAGGELEVTGAGELRSKESDRISALVNGLRAIGAAADERSDGFRIRSPTRLRGGRADAHGDHRLAMAFAVAALAADGPVAIDGADAAAVSYPTFFTDLERLRR